MAHRGALPHCGRMTDHPRQLLSLEDGRQASYVTFGLGDPLLWIEGGPGYPASLGIPDCELLASRFTCYLVDAPGSGESTPTRSPDEHRWPAIVAWFDAVRTALQIPQWTLMGHSWGGLIALAYAATHPAPVARLIVVDGYAGEASVPAEDAEAATAAALIRHQGTPAFEASLAPERDLNEKTTVDDLMRDMDPLYPLYFAYPERPASVAHIARLRREGALNPDASRAWDLDGYASSVDLTPILRNISAPTLVLVGEHDWVCGPVWAHHIAAHTPDARLHIFHESGHCPQYEEPDRFVRVVEDWLTAAGKTTPEPP